MALTVNAFPQCCGIKIITGFGKTANTLVSNTDEVKKVEEELTKIVAKQKATAKADEYDAVGLLMITLNHEQIAIYQEMMIRVGFVEVVTPFYHPAHESRIAVYTMTLLEQESYGSLESTLKKNVKKPTPKVTINGTLKRKSATTTKPAATVRSGGNPLHWRWSDE